MCAWLVSFLRYHKCLVRADAGRLQLLLEEGHGAAADLRRKTTSVGLRGWAAYMYIEYYVHC